MITNLTVKPLFYSYCTNRNAKGIERVERGKEKERETWEKVRERERDIKKSDR